MLTAPPIASLAGAAMAFFLCVGLIRLLAPLAERFRLVDVPVGRKQHASPTPVIGGLAIALAAFGLWLTGLVGERPPIGLMCAGVLLLASGVLDDIFDLRWPLRLIIQAAAALFLMIIDGTHVDLKVMAPDWAWASGPLTIIAMIGVINALNMADGIDGLVGTLVSCSLAMLLAAASYSGAAALLAPLLLVLGATLGFLTQNARFPWQPRARVFLGNSGSEFLGLVMVWAIFKLTQDPRHPVTAILGPFFLALPVIDCLVLAQRRMNAGRSPFKADRCHMHHLLQAAGLSVTATVAVMGGVSLLIGGTAALAVKADTPQIVLILAFVALTAAYGFITRKVTGSEPAPSAKVAAAR